MPEFSRKWADWTPGGQKAPRNELTEPTKGGLSVLSVPHEVVFGDSEPRISTGKALIAQANSQISDAWDEIKPFGRSLDEWIHRGGSYHGTRIKQAEDRVNAIGSQGDPAALKAACEAYVTEWRDGIAVWKRANGSGKARQGSFNLD